MSKIKWQRTPFWLRMFGYPEFRFWTEHCHVGGDFSFWTYADVKDATHG